MKQSNKALSGCIILLAAMLTSCNLLPKDEAMQVTSTSEKALELYKDAYDVAYRVLDLDKAVGLYEDAIKEDPDFFMAYYQLATFYLFHKNDSEFVKNAEAALACKAKLSFGEKMQSKILESWLQDRNFDVSGFGKVLVQIYPDDPDSYLNLGFIFYLEKNYPEAIKAFEQADTMTDSGSLYTGPKLAIVPVCMIGYAYLLSDQPEKAGESFDRYIGQFPGEQNPYDCKADYFLAVKDYEKAYESYMTAYNIDTTYKAFLKRADAAKRLADSLQVE